MSEGRLKVLTLYRRVLREARPYWLHLFAVLGLSLAAAPLALLIPVPLALVLDSVIGHHPIPGYVDAILPVGTDSPTAALIFAAGLFVVIQVLIRLQGMGSWVLQTYTGEKLLLHFRAKLFRHVQRLSLSYHDRRGTTDSTYRIQYDAEAIQTMTLDSLTPLVTEGFTLLAMMYVMARIDLVLAAVAMVVAPVLFVLIRIYSRRMRDRWYEVKRHQSSAMSVVQEVLGAVRVVKAFGQEDREQERFLHHSNQNVRGQIRLAWIGGALDILIGLALALGTGVVLYVGALHVRARPQILTAGQLTLVMAYLTQLYGPLETISKKFATLQQSLASADRAFMLLDEVPDVIERPNARPISRAAGAVGFNNVSFAYDDNHPVLHDITFDIPAGMRVGIVGTTGAGKTTLMSLLPRFYDPTSGFIQLDGVDLRDYRLADLRAQFAIVLQDTVLFSTSISENIAYGRPGATEEEIVRAARAAGAHDFVVKLPDGYDTTVGERGMLLSGGERQRISLARAFLKDAPILILDEPTSSVDVKTEAAIIEAMERLMVGRTSFIIAHRLSTISGVDAVLQLESGRLEAIRLAEQSTGGGNGAAPRANAGALLSHDASPGVTLLGDDDLEDRAAVLETLPAEIAHANVPLLVSALGDPNERLCRAAIPHLASLPEPIDGDAWRELLRCRTGRVLELASLFDRTGIEWLARLAQRYVVDGDEEDRALAEAILARSPAFTADAFSGPSQT